jgi:hypothetical protein
MNAIIVVTGLGIWAACAALAQTEAKPPASAPASVKASGSVAFVDPATRKIRKPGPSEIGAQRSQSQSQAAVAKRPVTPPVLIHGPGGAEGILLDDSHMSHMVATRNADGKIAFECVTGDARDRAAQSSQPAKAAAETK